MTRAPLDRARAAEMAKQLAERDLFVNDVGSQDVIAICRALVECENERLVLREKMDEEGFGAWLYDNDLFRAALAPSSEGQHARRKGESDAV